MAFCASCGTEVQGRFCAKCGTPAPAAGPAQGAPVQAAPPPAQPQYNPPPPQAPPPGGYAPPQGGYAQQQQAPPQSGYAQQPQGGYAPPPGGYGQQQGGYPPPPGGGYPPPPQGGYPQQGGYPPPPGPQSSDLADNIASALSYITIIGVVFLFIEPYSRNRTVRFHAFQSIFFCVAAFIAEIAAVILSAALGSLPGIGFVFGALLHFALGIGILIVWLLLVYKAYNNENFVLPILGPMAQKQV